MELPKFRAWFKNKKVMSEVKKINFWSEELDTVAFKEKSLEDVKLMQATGLFDKNGTEIFEGDILADVDESGDELVYLYVIYKDGKFMAVENEERGYFADLVDCTTYHSVVGNIYENAELLGRYGENKMKKLTVRGISTHEESKGEWKRGYLIEDEGMSYIINGVVEANDEYITIGEWCSVNPETIETKGMLKTMGIDLYGFVEGFDEAKGTWENISPLTDQSQLDYDGYGYPKEAKYLFGRTLPEMIDVVRDTELYTLLQDTSGEKIKGLSTLNVKDDTGKATNLTKDIFFYLHDESSLYVVELQPLKDYESYLEIVGSQKENLTKMITQIEQVGAGYSKVRFVYTFF